MFLKSKTAILFSKLFFIIKESEFKIFVNPSLVRGRFTNLEIYLKNFHYPFRTVQRSEKEKEVIIYTPDFSEKRYSIHIYSYSFSLGGEDYKYIIWDYKNKIQRWGKTEFDILEEMGVWE